VQAIADRNVDQAVLTADWDRRLRAVMGERKETRTLASAKNERKNFVVHRHDLPASYTAPCNVGVSSV
jgi:hypothetical protein